MVKMQEWVIETGNKIAVIFEGRDAAGKGGTIKRIIVHLNPRYCKVVPLQIEKNLNGISSDMYHFSQLPVK